MRSVRAISLFMALCVTVLVVAALQGQSGFSSVVTNLHKYQANSGGFVLRLSGGVKPSLEATSHALFLSSLFGLRERINAMDVARYIQTLENGDYGYGKSVGMASDLESVRHAVFSYQHLGQTIPNAANVAAYVKSLYDTERRLFADRVGEKGDLKSTALAFQTLEQLGELQRPWVQELMDNLKNYLEKHHKMGKEIYYSFPEEQDLSPISANYYGLVLASYVGHQQTSPAKWAAFLQGMQAEDGGFYSSLDKTATSLESTVHAVSSLRILQQAKDNTERFVDLIDSDKLLSYVSNVDADLRSAAQAHLAVALTKAFGKNFDIKISYDVLRSSGPVKSKVVQGTQLKPVLSVTTFDGVAHAGLDVEVGISYGSTKFASAKLQWNNGQYAADEFFDTANRLGEMAFDYVIRCYVVGVGEISLQKKDTKLVGYGLMVDSKARLEVTGKEFAEGETVAIGTDFRFSVALQNQTHDEFVSGDFSVTFSVLDSSLVALFTKTVDCRTNTAPVEFSYNLKSSNVPAGSVFFRFEVANAQGVHTTEDVVYQLAIPMIASAIAFEGFSRQEAPRYKIGDTVKVTIEPATFPDLRAVHPLAATDVNNQPIADRRKIFMDVKSLSGTLLRTVAGAPAAAGSKYLFQAPVSATLDSVGTHTVSFRYETASGDSIALANYDSVFGELYEDAAALNFTVKASLVMANVAEQPDTKDFFYGNDVAFRFRVKDAVSGKFVERGENALANVYLSLQHRFENRPKPFVSAHEAAVQQSTTTTTTSPQGDAKEFVIRWAINPNAVRGPGFLTLAAQDADGNQVQLFKEDGKTPVRYDVTIGGDINVTSSAHTTADFYHEATAFVVQFSLSCQDKSLKDAQLRCSVQYAGDAVAALLPVATNPNGEYSVSWVVPHSAAPSGQYAFRCFREVDRKLALEARQLEEKKRQREEELKQFDDQYAAESAQATAAADEEKQLDVEEALQPLFVITVSHSAPYTGKLPVRPEVLALVLFGSVFFLVSYQKKHYLKVSARK